MFAARFREGGQKIPPDIINDTTYISVMKPVFKIAVLLGCLTLSVPAPVIGCKPPADIPSSQARQIQIIIEPTVGTIERDKHGDSHFTEAPNIIFEDVTWEIGKLDHTYRPPRGIPAMPATNFNDPCFLISGTIRNDYDEGNWVAHHALGYDNSGNVVSVTLDQGPITGVARVYIEAMSAENFTLHLSWSDNVSLFRIFSQKSRIMPP